MGEQTAQGDVEWAKVGVLLYIAAGILVAIGLYTMFTYEGVSDGTGHLVEGDAYNYMIIATRGVGWIAAGIVVALMGVGALIRSAARN